MKQLLILTISFLLFNYSCRQASNTKSEKIIKDKRLLAFNSKIIYTVDSLEKLDNKTNHAIASSDFNPKTDTIKYLKNKIWISYLRNASGCADYAGDIKFNKDTINLLFVNTSNIVCAEVDTWRVFYEIENKDNKRYVIVKY
jgi:hypothetical protein